MESKRDLAIILKSLPYEERHRIVTALTEGQGVVSAMARNAIQSRRFGGALDLFAASEWLFVEKPGTELLRLDEAVVRRSYEGIRADFERLSVASVMSELMLRIAPKAQPCPELFRLHANALAHLEESPLRATGDSSDLALLNGYLAKLLRWSGSQPRLDSCLSCEKSTEQVASNDDLNGLVADAAWVCSECRQTQTRHVRDRQGQSFHHASLRLAPSAVRDFQLALELPIRQVPEAARASRREHQGLFRFLEALLVYHLPGFDQKPLKSLRFLDLPV